MEHKPKGELTPQDIIKNMKKLHKTDIELTPEIESLINYVSHVKYNEGWYNACKKYMKFIEQNTLWNRFLNLIRMIR